MIQTQDWTVEPSQSIQLRSNQKMLFENGIWRGPSVPLLEGHYQFGELLFKQLKKNADLIGQIDAETGVRDTYGNMLNRTIRCALWLKNQGIKPGDIVSLCTSDHLNAIIPLLATFMLGAVANVWWTNLPTDVTANVMKLYKPKVLFVEDDKIESMNGIMKDAKIDTLKIVCFQEMNEYLSFTKILSEQNTEAVSNFKCTQIESPDQLALILSTSGSTGLPKGVMIGYKTLLKLPVLPDIAEREKMSPTLNLSSFPWSAKIECHLNCIAAGITIIVYKANLNGPHPFEIIRKYKVGYVFMVVPMAMELIEDSKLKKYDTSSVKYASTGGTFISDNNFKEFAEMFPNARVFSLYGLTETLGVMSSSVHPRKPGSCGKLIANFDLKIINENGSTILKPRESGELCIRAYKLFLGYFENPELSANTLDSEGWLHTGDIAYFDEDGEHYITDRISELIKCVGYHMSASAIEEAIKEHPGVLQVTVVARFAKGEEKVVAFIVKKPDADFTKKDIIDLVPQKFPLLMVHYVIFLNKLPKLENGKYDKNVLRKLVQKMSVEDIVNNDVIENLNV